MRRRPFQVLIIGMLGLSLVFAGSLAATGGSGKAKGKEKDRAATRSATISLPGDAVYPEGIAAAGKYIYTGSSQQGTIFRAMRRGSAAEVLSAGGTDGRTAAIGMKADRKGNLVVAGGGTGKVFVLDRATGATRGVYSRPATGGVYSPSSPTFLNDVVITKSGDAYITDSFSAVIYRIPAQALTTPSMTGTLEEWLAGPALAPIAYQNGFNLNGIVAKRGVLLVVQANTGKLYRIGIATKRVQEVVVTGTTLTGGDGLVLHGDRALYVVHEGKVDVLKLSRHLTRARLKKTITDATFDSPTTAAIHKGRLYVVNSQFGKLFATPPVAPTLPFTISVIKPGKSKGHK